MTDSPHYPEARAILYVLLRAARVPEELANEGVAEALEKLADFAAQHGSVPVAEKVVVTDHRGTRLAAEHPDLHRAQVAALGAKLR